MIGGEIRDIEMEIVYVSEAPTQSTSKRRE